MRDQALGGLHHVTAITGNAAGNVDFYTRALGMRMVKKTVNQDDVSAYHLFYADALGSPGTDLTFFDWPASPANTPGAPSLGPIRLRVHGPEAITFWTHRLRELNVEYAVTELAAATVGPAIAFNDPEGQRLLLVDDGNLAGGQPWPRSEVPPEFQVAGLDGVGLVSARADMTLAVLVQAMGFRLLEERALEGAEGTEFHLEAGAGGPGTRVIVTVPPRSPWATQGRGGIHHVAFRVGGDAEQVAWQQALTDFGLQPTPVIDRFYFKSVYFREPGGNLFEIATDGPGFSADEPIETMGSHLALPPFLEPRRAEIESGLQPIV